MLDIRVEIKGERVVIDGLDRVAGRIPGAVNRGLERVAKGVHREAMALLSGPGRSPMRIRDATDEKGNIVRRKTRLRGQSDWLGAKPGSYPVPVISGHLRQQLDWLKPGETKSGAVGTFTAGFNEAIVFDSAEYAVTVHEGKFSNEVHGPRPYLTDALERFNSGGRIAGILNEEINREMTIA
jgi:hypothetical protein